MELTKRSSTVEPRSFMSVKDKLSTTETKVTPMDGSKNNIVQFLGWAVSILLAIGLFAVYNQNKALKSELDVVQLENNLLEEKITDSDTSLEKTKTLLNTIRDKDITVILLGGQAVSPESYVKAYWKKQEQKCS